MTKLVKNIFTVFLILILLGTNVHAASSNTKNTVASASVLGGLLGIISGLLVGEVIKRNTGKDYGYLSGSFLFGSLGILGATAIAKHHYEDGDDISTSWVFSSSWIGIVLGFGAMIYINYGENSGYVPYFVGISVMFGTARLGAEIGDKSKR